MFNLILYDISTAFTLLASFLILVFIIGTVLFLLTKDFIFKSGRIKIYGMFMNINRRDLTLISSMIVRSYLIIFGLFVPKEQVNMYLIMITIISVIFIVFYMENVIYEIINSIALVVIKLQIYLIL